MSKFTSRLVNVGLGHESTRGVGVAASYWLPKTELSFDNKTKKALVAGSYGNISDAAMTAYVTGKWAEGNIDGEINIDSFGLILLALFGTESASTDDPESGVCTHSYTLQNDNQHDSLSIHLHDPIGQLQFKMAMINSLGIDITLGEIVKYTANFISKASVDSSSTPSYITDKRFTSRDLTFKVANSVSALSAASAISVKHLTLNFEKNTKLDEVLGTLEPENILNMGLKISGSIELNYEDRTWRNYMLNGNTKAMQIKLESSQTIGVSTNPKLEFVFPKATFSEWEPKHALDDIVGQSINFEVLLDISTDPARLWSSASLINSTNSAY